MTTTISTQRCLDHKRIIFLRWSLRNSCFFCKNYTLLPSSYVHLQQNIDNLFKAGPALVVVPVVPWNHSFFEKGPMEPSDFWDVVQCKHINFKFAAIGTTRFEFTAPALQRDTFWKKSWLKWAWKSLLKCFHGEPFVCPKSPKSNHPDI